MIKNKRCTKTEIAGSKSPNKNYPTLQLFYGSKAKVSIISE